MTTNFENIALQCADCGVEFDFSVEEQEFYSEKGFSQPRRCRACRSRNRQNKGNRRGGGGGGRPQARFDVTCSACGARTTVPFKPTNDRPVYCSDCYKR